MVWRVVAGIAGFAVAGVYGWMKRDEIVEMTSDLWDSLILRLKGKKIAVLGARGSGKTTLLTFLSKGELPAETAQTIMASSVSARRFSLKDLNLDLKETRDLPGGEGAFDDWKKLHDESDYVIYLIKSAGLDKDRIAYDLKKINEWRSAEKCKSKFLIVATHMDLDSAYMALKPQECGDFFDRFVNDLGRCLAPFKTPPALILGSLENQKHTEKLVSEIIGWMNHA
ncbi:ADP-ribosylation factor-like protein [Pseudomonas sp. 24 R 17]|uniref:ADP-ribosylation factor-like protein n=1 Tax=Pseudomonas sp. 24 R 17 TaxID=1844096 RepID=UPI0008124EB8|nr:ADP-ribosylation factor-like protein [Pseudomonas sp. 24 R 17]CRM04839.1 ADP-ribosylation factor family protein [Pseudomonas sp. 24 R 17]